MSAETPTAVSFSETVETPHDGAGDDSGCGGECSTAERLRERVDALKRELSEYEQELEETRAALTSVKSQLQQQRTKTMELRGRLKDFEEDGSYQVPDHGHHDIIATIVSERGSVVMSELYEEYSERVENPRTKRSVRNYLTDLCNAGRVEAVGQRRGRVYRPADEASDQKTVEA